MKLEFLENLLEYLAPSLVKFICKISFYILIFLKVLLAVLTPTYIPSQNPWFLDFPFLYFSWVRTDANGQKRRKRKTHLFCFGKIWTSLASIPNISYTIRKRRKRPTKQYFFLSWRTGCSGRKKSSVKLLSIH